MTVSIGSDVSFKKIPDSTPNTHPHYHHEMKAICISTLLLGMTTLHAGIKIPKGIYTSSQLEEARAKAASDNLPIVYVMTDSGST